LADPGTPRSVQPYHAAEPLALPDADRFLQRCTNATKRLACQELQKAVDDLSRQGYHTAACGLVLASGRPLPDLAAILASHALIHTAEGEFFREAVAHASERCKLPMLRVRERDLLDKAATLLRIAADDLTRHLTAVGRALGPPWRQDEKYAMLAAVLALASAEGHHL